MAVCVCRCVHFLAFCAFSPCYSGALVVPLLLSFVSVLSLCVCELRSGLCVGLQLLSILVIDYLMDYSKDSSSN